MTLRTTWIFLFQFDHLRCMYLPSLSICITCIQAWKLYQEGKQLELVDSGLSNYNRGEVAKCIQLGLLCCQATVPERPDMSSVHLMLLSNLFDLPKPSRPGIQGRAGYWTTTTNSISNPLVLTLELQGIPEEAVSVEYPRNSIPESSIDELGRYR